MEMEVGTSCRGVESPGDTSMESSVEDPASPPVHIFMTQNESETKGTSTAYHLPDNFGTGEPGA
jgi:hypothetical protein